jgi:DNA-binding NarL/FixJ family response regulator
MRGEPSARKGYPQNGQQRSQREALAPSANEIRAAVQPEDRKTNVRSLRLEPGSLGTVWVECPYPIVALGFERTLHVAGYDVRLPQSGQQAANGHDERHGGGGGGAAPCCAIYCPEDGDDVAVRVQRLRRLSSDAPVLVLGRHAGDLPLARAALRGGARGFLHLGMQPSQIARALSLASEGETVFPRELTLALINEDPPPDLQALTPRQREILGLVARGLTNAEIGRELYLMEGTVKQHLRGAYKALGVTSRVQAVRLLEQHELYAEGGER